MSSKGKFIIKNTVSTEKVASKLQKELPMGFRDKIWHLPFDEWMKISHSEEVVGIYETNTLWIW